jgi:hypothetical protein
VSDEDDIIETVYSLDQSKRVHFFRRRNGTFGYQDEFFDVDEYGSCWIPLSNHHSIFDSAETAIREARGRLDWLLTLEEKGA